jgi:MFS family permease
MRLSQERALSPASRDGAASTGKLWLICASRLGTSMATMAYAGCLPFVLAAWDMGAAQAGTVQAAFNLAAAASLLLTSWLADRVGAKRVFLVSAWGTAVAFAVFALVVRSYESALLLYPLVALLQGGTYTPALMLVADEAAPRRRGRAIGRTLAASSLGYVVSIALTTGGAALLSYRWGLLACAAGPLAGAVAGTLALRTTPHLVHREAEEASLGFVRLLRERGSLLLTGGYVAHCWELLGLWAWAPAYLASAIGAASLGGAPLAGLSIAAALHLAGFAATLVMGDASDRWGRRTVLLATATAGALFSFSFGWCAALPAPLLLAIAFVYSFTAIGDSGVLSAAMTEAVPASHLGRFLAVRSVLGFSAGAVSPVVFGWVLDATNAPGAPPEDWGWAFMALGVGGAAAALAAALLPAGATRLAAKPLAAD